jgi:RNase adaptor protein for sRNA GlmZ degradation
MSIADSKVDVTSHEGRALVEEIEAAIAKYQKATGKSVMRAQIQNYGFQCGVPLPGSVHTVWQCEQTR